MEPVVLIADDHSLIRKGLKLYLQLDLGYADIYEVSNCHDLMMELVKKKYTHLILDIILSDGSSLEVIPNIRRLYPEIRILVFSMQPEVIYGAALKQYGIHYYLPKATVEQETIRTLQLFLTNEPVIKDSSVMPGLKNSFTSLTTRELEILHYILNGLGTKEISETLNLKMNTVSTLKKHIYEKTNAGNVKELLELASLYNISY